MRKYGTDIERAIRTERVVREWLRSNLIDREQYGRMAVELKVDLRRTNFFLRAVLFGFGLLIIAAAVLLTGLILKLSGESDMGMLCVLAAGAFFVAAESLIDKFRLYRFGVEEAAATGSALLFSAGCAALSSSTFRSAMFVGVVTAAVAFFVVYVRFGYVYTAIAAMVFTLIAPFQIQMPGAAQRLTAAALLGAIFAVTRFKWRESDREYPGDEFAVIQASAWAGIYVVLNLQLPVMEPFRDFGVTRGVASPIYWLTYVIVWLMPALGIYLGVRYRDRVFLDVNIILALLTLSTNKPYLGAERQTWDPILLGLFLIGIVIVVRRWLAAGANNSRDGFTAVRLLSSDKRRISMVGTASAALPTGPSGTTTPSSRDFEPGGGRSGGGGASGEF